MYACVFGITNQENKPNNLDSKKSLCHYNVINMLKLFNLHKVFALISYEEKSYEICLLKLKSLYEIACMKVCLWVSPLLTIDIRNINKKIQK